MPEMRLDRTRRPSERLLRAVSGRLPGVLAARPLYPGGGGQVNGWYLSGIVVWRGQKRGERGPWPCMIEADGGTRDNPTVRVPLDIFGDVEVGQHVELTGFLESREWQGRNFLQLTVKTRKVEWLNPAASQRQADPPPPAARPSSPWPGAASRPTVPPRPLPVPMPDPAGENYNPEEDIPF